MASISGAELVEREPRSGGKMLRQRRAKLRTTPYDRPRLLISTQQNPNWISRHIFSPTRTIVTGAGRVLSSVFGLESSSSSSSDCDSSSDEADDNNDDQDVSPQGVHTLDHREPQSFAGKNETKRLIEQLLMRETFSREECDKLTNIIKSRVVDSPMLGDMGVVSETPNTTDVEIHDLCSAAVMEARKWLEEKKSGSNSKSELHHGTSAVNTVSLTHGAEVAAGSPVDMAKSYMRTRPPWSSPSTNNIEFRSPSPIRLPLFKEETPYLTGGKSLSSSKLKRGSPATGSWNIQDEIRKVRSKATEEMLRTLSSSKVDLSSFSQQHKSSPEPLVANNVGPVGEDNPQSVYASLPVSQISLDALNDDALPSPVTLGCEQNKDMEAIPSIEGGKDSQVKNCSTLSEVAGMVGAASTANGFPSSLCSVSAELDKEQNHRPINEVDSTVGSDHENKTQKGEEQNCELLSEATLDVPIVNETDAVASGSQDSSSMQNEGSLQYLNTEDSKPVLAGKSNSGVEKQQQGKRVTRYNRRSRGRGR